MSQPIETETGLRAYVGRTGAVCFGSGSGAWFAISIIDARVRWGQTDVLVTPVTGSGSFWTSIEKVDLS
jgi:hypothetical protein